MNLQNIGRTGAFTISVPSVESVRQADYFGMVSGRSADKFAASRFTPVRSEVVDASDGGAERLVLELDRPLPASVRLRIGVAEA